MNEPHTLDDYVKAELDRIFAEAGYKLADQMDAEEAAAIPAAMFQANMYMRSAWEEWITARLEAER